MSYLQKRLPCVNQAPVVQKVDSAIHWITQLVSQLVIHWTMILAFDQPGALAL